MTNRESQKKFELVGFLGRKVIYYDEIRKIFLISGKSKYKEFYDLWELRSYVRNSRVKFISVTNKIFCFDDLIKNNPFRL